MQVYYDSDCDMNIIRDRKVAIIGYGKLGGIELGYASDLDLVFIYDADPGAGPERCLCPTQESAADGHSELTVVAWVQPADRTGVPAALDGLALLEQLQRLA